MVRIHYVQSVITRTVDEFIYQAVYGHLVHQTRILL